MRMNELPEYNAPPSAPQLINLDAEDCPEYNAARVVTDYGTSNIDLVPNLPILKSIRIGEHRLLLSSGKLITVIQYSNISSMLVSRSRATLEEVIRINRADKIEPTFIRIDKDTVCYKDKRELKNPLMISDLLKAIISALIH